MRIIRLNFWDEAWCVFFWLWFFELLSSSLLLLVETQRFSRCILQPPQVSHVYLDIEMIWITSSCFLNALFDQQSNFKKWFAGLNPFYAHINKGHLKKAGEYSGQIVVLQQATIKIRTTVKKLQPKYLLSLWYFSFSCKN